MVVAAITIAVTTAMPYFFVRVIPNSRAHNKFKHTVQKFGIYLGKKLEVDYFLLLAPKMVSFLLILREMKPLNARLLVFL
jgi:hypothetical protein